MRFLLDTNVISEVTRPSPDQTIVAWLDQHEDALYLSVISLLEIRFGIELTESEVKRKQLDKWLQTDLPERFFGRILPIDKEVADLTGRILARSKQKGWNTDSMDALIAATAMTYDMALATMNRKHFEMLQIKFVDF